MHIYIGLGALETIWDYAKLGQASIAAFGKNKVNFVAKNARGMSGEYEL